MGPHGDDEKEWGLCGKNCANDRTSRDLELKPLGA